MTQPAKADGDPASAPVKPSTLAPLERVIVIPTRIYWLALGLAVLTALMAYLFDDPDLPGRGGSFPVVLVLLFLTYLVAALVVLWAIVGLIRRGRILHRSVQATKRFERRLGDRARMSAERHEGALGRFGDRWRNRFLRVGRFVGRILLRLWRGAQWVWYTLEKLLWYLPLLLYDVVYYPLFAAWVVLLFLLRIAGAVARFLLRVAWSILKVLTKLPFARKLWAKTLRPQILAAWKRFRERQRTAREERRLRRRERASSRGLDPDAIEAARRQRRGFPLPNPDKTRAFVRARIDRIREIQRARREGRSVPHRRRNRVDVVPARELEPRGEPAPLPHVADVSPPVDAEHKKRLRNLLLKGRKARRPEPDASDPDASEGASQA